MKSRRNITIEDKLWEKMDAKAKSKSMSVSAYISQLALKDLKIKL